MQINLKISQQGLILVGVPIALMLGVLIYLFVLLSAVEKEAQEVDRSKDIIATAESLVKKFYDAGSQLMFYKYTKSDVSRLRFEEQLTSTRESFGKLSDLLKDNPDEMAKLDELKRSAERGVGLLVRFEQRLQQSGDMPAIEATLMYKRFEMAGADFTGKLHSLVAEETERHRITSAVETKDRLLVKTVIGSGVAMAVLTGIVLALLFTRNTTSRLSLLMDNTRRVAKKESLLPRLQGEDEIAQLDKFFHQMADELEEAARKEKEVEQLKQDFIAMVSHELRTPLTSLSAFCSLLSEGAYGELTESGHRGAVSAENGISRLITLITDLLDIEKMEAGKLGMIYRDVDLKEIIERSRESVEGYAQQQGVRLALPAECRATVLADSDRMVQVMVNFLSNAIKFSKSGEAVEIAVLDQADALEVQVIDHGAGIPQGFEEKVFAKYEQLPSPDGKKRVGTGLGLPISKAIVEQHGGTVGVRRTEGGGSTFWFTLPKVGAAV